MNKEYKVKEADTLQIPLIWCSKILQVTNKGDLCHLNL